MNDRDQLISGTIGTNIEQIVELSPGFPLRHVIPGGIEVKYFPDSLQYFILTSKSIDKILLVLDKENMARSLATIRYYDIRQK